MTSTDHIATNSDNGHKSHYPGGKGNTFRHIINEQPPHSIYIEPFLGAGSVMRHKQPAAVNIGIDLDRAAADIASQERAMAAPIADNGDTAGDYLPAPIATIGEPSAQFTFIQADALEWLAKHGPGLPQDALMYVDPPYLMSTRRAHRPLWRCELGTEDEHKRLIDILSGLPCMVQLSGYWSELYADLLSDWRYISFKSVTRGGSVATEYLWMNYGQPQQLHDSQWLGNNFREREKFNRRKARMIARLKRLPLLERQSLLDAVDQWRAAEASPKVASRSVG